MGVRASAEILEAARPAVARLTFVAAAWLFGSLARGEARDDSDLDLAILLEHDGEPTDDERAQLAELASQLEPLSPGGRVDLLVLGRAGPILHHHVVRDGLLVLDRDPSRRVDFVTRAIIEFLDWEPTQRVGMEASLAGLQARLARGAA